MELSGDNRATPFFFDSEDCYYDGQRGNVTSVMAYHRVGQSLPLCPQFEQARQRLSFFLYN